MSIAELISLWTVSPGFKDLGVTATLVSPDSNVLKGLPSLSAK